MRNLAFASVFAAFAVSGCFESNDPSPSGSTEQSSNRIAQVPRAHSSESTYSFDDTLRRLYEALDRRDLTVFAVVDHAAGAAAAGLEMPPSTVVIFGAATIGTPLMIAEPQMSLELPLRAAVYEDADGTVHFSIVSMSALQHAYENLEEQRMRMNGIQNNLSALEAEVTGTES